MGDSIKVGTQRFRIAGGLQVAPGEAAVVGSVQPRVYLPMDYLAATQLLQRGSRVEYKVFIKLPGGRQQAEEVADALKPQESLPPKSMRA